MHQIKRVNYFTQVGFPFNPFYLNVPFLCPLETSENLLVFWCFQRVQK